MKAMVFFSFCAINSRFRFFHYGERSSYFWYHCLLVFLVWSRLMIPSSGRFLQFKQEISIVVLTNFHLFHGRGCLLTYSKRTTLHFVLLPIGNSAHPIYHGFFFPQSVKSGVRFHCFPRKKFCFPFILTRDFLAVSK